MYFIYIYIYLYICTVLSQNGAEETDNKNNRPVLVNILKQQQQQKNVRGSKDS